MRIDGSIQCMGAIIDYATWGLGGDCNDVVKIIMTSPITGQHSDRLLLSLSFVDNKYT